MPISPKKTTSAASKVLYRFVISLSRSCGCVLPDAISVVVMRLFGKPEVQGERRMGVVLACGDSLAEARQKAKDGAATVAIAL